VTCSVCIPTYRRAKELAGCLGALASQATPPDEIVVSDAGGDHETRAVLASFSRGYQWSLRHCATERRGLPWQRWWAFQHSTGSIAFFIDDDVRLMPDAIAVLLNTYQRMPGIVGAGFAIAYDGSSLGVDTSIGLRERWLGIAGARPGTVTPGGITIELPLKERDGEIEEVEWLPGGAMSYRREVLEAVGPLDRLYDLYDAHIGRSEDSLLSTRVRCHGPLVMIPGVYATHPALEHATRTESPQDGYQKGLLETWGRAHVLRWLARDAGAAFRAWLRAASLEIARAVKAVLAQPVASSRWLRIAGGIVGIQRTIRRWRAIPAHPGRASA